jgi:hypothetical protein
VIGSTSVKMNFFTASYSGTDALGHPQVEHVGGGFETGHLLLPGSADASPNLVSSPPVAVSIGIASALSVAPANATAKNGRRISTPQARRAGADS